MGAYDRPMTPASTPRPHGMAKYRHVADVLRRRIQAGAYAAGAALPSEPGLIAEFGFDRGTVRRGLSVLRQEGLITSEQGRGVHVRRTRTLRHELLHILRAEADNNDQPLNGLFESGTNTTTMDVEVAIRYTPVEASEALANAFEIAPTTSLLERRYTFLVNSVPHQITRSYLLAEMCEGTPLSDPKNERAGRGTHMQLLSVGVEIDFISMDIMARMPTPTEATDLLMGDGTPVLVDQRRSLAQRRVVCVADTLTPADRIRFGLDLDLKD
jgi:GntR family transcriptional regulator